MLQMQDNSGAALMLPNQINSDSDGMLTIALIQSIQIKTLH